MATELQSKQIMADDEYEERMAAACRAHTAYAEAHPEIDAWLATRVEAGLKIDPETAEVYWIHARTLDPYGVYPELPEEFQQIGREYFARSPGSDVWVNFSDLPEATRDTLWEKHKRKLAFPAGLSWVTTIRSARRIRAV